MVLARGHREPVTVDQFGKEELCLRGGYRPEPHGHVAVGGTVDDEVVRRLEAATGRCRVAEEQPMEMAQQAQVERTPVLLEKVVLGVPVAGEFLLAPGAEGLGPASNDPVRPAGVRD